MQLQKTMFSSQKLKKTSFTDYRKLSQNDAKNTQVDKILLTQSNAFSLVRMKPLKAKLPQITWNSSQSSFNSQNGRISRLCISVNQIEKSMLSLKEQLQNIKSNATIQAQDLRNQLQKTQKLLTSRTERLGTMVEYTINQDKLRTARIKQDCSLLEHSDRLIKNRLEQLKQRMETIEKKMGVYTGEDKHLV